jgi:hypothetical protein
LQAPKNKRQLSRGEWRKTNMTDKKVNDRIKYDMASNNAVHVAGLPCWLWQLVEETRWV